MNWLRGVLNEVIEAGAELANEYEPDQKLMEKQENAEPKKDTVEKEEFPQTFTLDNTISANVQSNKLAMRRNRSRSTVERKPNLYTKTDPIDLGITPLLMEYVRNLCQHPQTWVEFPLEAQLAARKQRRTSPADQPPELTTEDYLLSGKEEAHAIAILKQVPELNQLRYKICPRQLSENRFWKIYFLLLSNKLQLQDSDEYFRLPHAQTGLSSNAFHSLYSRYAVNSLSLDTHRVKFSAPDSGTLEIDDSEHPWWHANIRGYRTKAYKTSYSHPSHGQQGLNSNWERMDLPLLKQDRPKIFKLLLRCGVPDLHRPQAWKISPTPTRASLAPKEEVKNKRFSRNRSKSFTGGSASLNHSSYHDHLKHVFGNEVPIVCSPIPTFGETSDLCFHSDHYLSPGGILAAKRILVGLAMTKPKLHYAPVLTDLIPILLSFMPEDDAFSVADILINESLERCHYLALGNRSLTLFGITFEELLQLFLPELHSHFLTLELDVKKIFIGWISSLFVNTLPYQTVLRMMDCLLYEGSNVLYKTGLAIFARAQQKLLKCKTSELIHNKLKKSSRSEEDCDAFLKAAFMFKIKHQTLVEIYSAIVEQGKLSTVSEFEMQIFNPPKINTASDIISTDQFERLWGWIPHQYQLDVLTQAYNSKTDGFNLRTLILKCEYEAPTLLLIKTSKEKVFGAFIITEWKRGEHYYGSGESFLFTLEPKEVKYSWNPESNELFMRLIPKQVTFGGGGKGDGLRLDEELWHGQSYECVTYGNQPLHGDTEDPEFECVTVEVYALRQS